MVRISELYGLVGGRDGANGEPHMPARYIHLYKWGYKGVDEAYLSSVKTVFTDSLIRTCNYSNVTVKLTRELISALRLNFGNIGGISQQDRRVEVAEFIKEWVRDGNDTKIMGD